jgi:hypothetical protein
MTNDFGRKAVTMIMGDGAHPCSMPHPLVEPTSIINLTIPFRKGECRYVINGFEDLPKVGNLLLNAKPMG